MMPVMLSKHKVPYYGLVKSVTKGTLIGYWPLWEPSGSTADNFEGTSDRDGSYTSVTLGANGIGDGMSSAQFDGSNSVVDVYSASLASAFDGGEGTMFLWGKVTDADVWENGVIKRIFSLGVGVSNHVRLYKDSTDNTFIFRYRAGGTVDAVTVTTSTTDWIPLACTWSATDDEVKGYADGVQVGSTQTGLGTWSGSLGSSLSVVGALNTSAGNAWDGWIQHAIVCDSALSAGAIAALSNPRPQ